MGAFAATGMLAPAVHAAEDHTIRLALIGCGGRGRGAAINALEGPNQGPVQLHALADLTQEKVDFAHRAVARQFEKQVDAPAARRFVGFEAYKAAIDCLRPGDVALLTAYAYCRPTHLEYAIEKGVNVFMEKSFAPDPGGLNRVLRLGEEAEKKDLKIAAGLMCRHSVNRQAMIEKIRAGELGEVNLARAYRMGRGWKTPFYRGGENELLWQIRNWIGFFWVSSGLLIEMMIHQADELCWIFDAWPEKAHGLGGRYDLPDSGGRNFDTYAVEYTFPGGRTGLLNYREAPGGKMDFRTFVHGTKMAGQFSGHNHKGDVFTFKGKECDPKQVDWQAPPEPRNPWNAEWRVLLDAIRNNKPHNETRRAVMANFAAVMGRAAVHTAQEVTWEQATGSHFRFGPDVDHMTEKTEPPVKADERGGYPIPVPGTWQEI